MAPGSSSLFICLALGVSGLFVCAALARHTNVMQFATRHDAWYADLSRNVASFWLARLALQTIACTGKGCLLATEVIAAVGSTCKLSKLLLYFCRLW